METRSWLNFYYSNPRPELFADIIAAMIADGSFKGLPEIGFFDRLGKKSPLTFEPWVQSDWPMIAFISLAMNHDPEGTAGWIELAESMPPGPRRSMAVAMWWAKTNASVAALERWRASGPDKQMKYLLDELEKLPSDVLQFPVNGPVTLDLLWLSFFATGDIAFVHQIIGALQLLAAEENTPTHAIGSAALWSLGQNAREHPLIEAHCRELRAQPKQNAEGFDILLDSILEGCG